jgi:hypothetical protein
LADLKALAAQERVPIALVHTDVPHEVIAPPRRHYPEWQSDLRQSAECTVHRPIATYEKHALHPARRRRPDPFPGLLGAGGDHPFQIMPYVTARAKAGEAPQGRTTTGMRVNESE